MFTPTVLIDHILAIEASMTMYFTSHPVGIHTASFYQPLFEANTLTLKLLLIAIERNDKKHVAEIV